MTEPNNLIIDKTNEEAGAGYQILGAKKYEQSNSGAGSAGVQPSGEEPQSIRTEASMDNAGISGEPQIVEPGISGEPTIEEPAQTMPDMPL